MVMGGGQLKFIHFVKHLPDHTSSESVIVLFIIRHLWRARVSYPLMDGAAENLVSCVFPPHDLMGKKYGASQPKGRVLIHLKYVLLNSSQLQFLANYQQVMECCYFFYKQPHRLC
jgi:hypothetical protein